MPFPVGSSSTYSDSSGQRWGECPVCTEVVTVSPSGKVEPHPRLFVRDGLPQLGAQCGASGKRLGDFPIGASS